MNYETEAIINLLKECGVSYKLNPKIKCNMHPHMRILIRQLKKHTIKYMYFNDSDTLSIVTTLNKNTFSALANTYVIPSSEGLEVYINLKHDDVAQDIVTLVETTLQFILSRKLKFTIVGVI